MLIVIVYSEGFESNAKSLRAAVKEKWDDASVNMMGIKDSINKAKYQIQLDGSVVYSGVNTIDNTTIINSIKERL